MEKEFFIPDWSGKTILVAEDVDSNYMLISALLRKTKVSVLRATNGQEALEMIQQHPQIIAILMDISMPGMDGIEATRLIKENFPDKIIIVQTAHARDMYRDKMNAEGCNDYLLKPLRQKMLIETLSKYLS